MAVHEEVNEITAELSAYLLELLGSEQAAIAFSEGPLDLVEAEFGGSDLADLDVVAAIEKACADLDLDPSVQTALVSAAASASAGSASASASVDLSGDETITMNQLVALLSENVQIVYEDNDYITNNIDQSLDIHGEVHGNVTQENDSNIVNATGEGSMAVGGDIEDSTVQAQTGDGVQIGGDNEGVANVGDNSGQMAGEDAEADNVTSGNNNSVGSDGSTVGDGNVNMEHVNINESALEFGEGDNTQQADDIEDSFNSASATTDIDADINVDSHDQDSNWSHNNDSGEDNSTWSESYTQDDHSQYSDDDSAEVYQDAGDDAHAHTTVDD